jgi:curved DNA-binding protein CbpA
MQFGIKRRIAFNSLKDYYSVMGLQRSASASDIKKKFIQLTKTYHPDVNAKHAEKFKEINEAYTVLSKESIRREYDQSRKPNQSTTTSSRNGAQQRNGYSGSAYQYSVV